MGGERRALRGPARCHPAHERRCGGVRALQSRGTHELRELPRVGHARPRRVNEPIARVNAGVVSGDVGAGQYVGEVLEYNPTDTITKVTALYHINGGTHQFTARLSVTQDNKKGTAVLTGVVTDGWMKGSQVSGSYQVIGPSGIVNAQQGVGGDYAYQGTITIHK